MRGELPAAAGTDFRMEAEKGQREKSFKPVEIFFKLSQSFSNCLFQSVAFPKTVAFPKSVAFPETVALPKAVAFPETVAFPKIVANLKTVTFTEQTKHGC